MLSPGQLVDGKYRILSLLGEGGMGLVYVAEHERMARRVALKVVRTQSSSEVLERFKREAQALARVNSPYVAEALDADVFIDGTPYLVMELLQGRDLRVELRQRGPLPIGEAVAYVVQSCRGVAAAHRAGIVHRDLKPHNLFLTNAGDLRRVKVVDFGIAKFLDAEDGSFTSSLLAVGTPLYMSPEHIRDPRSVSTPADVWALGVILYELLAGFSPFADASTGAIVAAITLDDPADLRHARPDVPRGLARIVHSALTKDRSKRMPSVEALAEALKPFALADEALTIDEQTFREGPGVELPKPLPRQLALEVRQEIARHVEAQSGSDTAPDRSSPSNPADARQPGEETERVPSLGLITARPPPPSKPSPAQAALEPPLRGTLPELQPPNASRRARVFGGLGVSLALVLAAVLGHFVGGARTRGEAAPPDSPAPSAQPARVAPVALPAVIPTPESAAMAAPAPLEPTRASEPNRLRTPLAAHSVPLKPATPVEASPHAPDGNPIHL